MLTNLGYLGSLGSDWINIEFFLSKLITQNILYSAYHKPHTITEIADLLGIKADLVEEEIDFLEKNGFIDIVDITDKKKKFLTNILIHDLSIENIKKVDALYYEYVNIICETYIPLILDSSSTNITPYVGTHLCCPPPPNSQTTISSNINVPENDSNFMLWSLISFALTNKFDITKIKQETEKHLIKRNDGSEYNLYATPKFGIQNSLSSQATIDMNKNFYPFIFNYKSYPYEFYPFSVWLHNTIYDNRANDWNRSLTKKFIYLYDYMMGRLQMKNNTSKPLSEIREKSHVFEGLFEHGLLAKQNIDSENSNHNQYINLIVSKLTFQNFLASLPPIPKDLIELNYEYANTLFNITKDDYPEHILDLCQVYYLNSFSSSEILNRVTDILLKKGILNTLKEHQKKTVNMIMFISNS